MAQKYAALSTRTKATEIVREAERSGSDKIDLSGVEFVSRSFADELVNVARERGLKIVGAEGDVAKMLEIVKS